jgi:hypothetical protein
MDIHTFTIGVGSPGYQKRRDLPYARNSADSLAISKWGSPSDPDDRLTFIDKTANIADVVGQITKLGAPTKDSKILISFSGHGRHFVDNVDGWQLYDDFLGGAQIVDLLSRFNEKAHVTVVSDCCYAGNLLDGLKTTKHAATILAISATGLTGLAFPEQDPPRPEQAVSALVKALEELEPGTPPTELEAALREKLRGKIYQQVPVVKRYEAK